MKAEKRETGWLDTWPGLRTALRDEVMSRPDAHVEVTSARNLVEMSRA